jgi:hypothetical protein
MGIHLRIECRQRQMQAQVCSVCRQIIDQKSQNEGEKLGKSGLLKGWDLCPCCHQEVEDAATDLAYKKRFVRWCIKHRIKPR